MLGKFIVIEGIDGAGTSTQAELLAEWYRANGQKAHVTHEPTLGPIGSLIIQALRHRFTIPGQLSPCAPSWSMMALLFAADRLDHLEAEVLPRLREGTHVISDRYDLSSLTYQSQTAENPTEVVSWIQQLNKYAKRPDITLVVNVSPEIAAKRRSLRASPTELYEVEALQCRLAEAYRNAEQLVPHDNLRHIDGNEPIAKVQEAILKAVENL